MIHKIVSGGQTGADRAALDVAIEMDIDHGGWVPRGRRTESGPLDTRYRLRETESTDYAERTRRNVRDSDGTLIVSHGSLTGGSTYTQVCALKMEKPLLSIDLDKTPAFQAALKTAGWIRKHDIGILNVAGPRDSEDPRIYRSAAHLLQTLLHLDLAGLSRYGLEGEGVPMIPDDPVLPCTVEQATERLADALSWREKARMARMSDAECRSGHPDIVRRIRREFRLPLGNAQLLESCREAAGDPELPPEAAEGFLLSFLLQKLRRTHGLRRIK
jgi:hypothetical protein